MFARSLLKSSVSATRAFSTRTSGKVKFFNSKKGYGFIVVNDSAEDVFVHQTSIVKNGFRSLAIGEDVEFDIVISEMNGKKTATNVTGPNGAEVIGAPRLFVERRQRDEEH